MEDNKKIIDDFISTLSHEIRTPLTSIKGFSQTLYDNYDVLDDGQKKKFIQIIKEQSQRLINLTENILSVTKLNHENKVILKEIDLSQIINKTLDIIKINYKTHKFEVHIPSNIPHSLSDYDKLQQILLNIIENACKYSPQNSTIKISASEQNKKNIIKIRDEGIGIEKDAIPKIFDKFYRIGDSTKNIAQGSGLGLYISAELAKKINAEIKVQSDTSPANHYTEFQITTQTFDVEEITKSAISRG